MPVPVPTALLAFIREGTDFIITGHKEPDGDCAGSQLALASLLRRMGKTALACSAGPFKRSEIKSLEKHFAPCPEKRDGLRLIVMDCSAQERVGDLPLDGMPTAVVDHHEPGNSWGDIHYLDPRAPSVTFMVLRIFEELGMAPSVEEAELLLFGLCTDTGFFRHLEAGMTEAFRAAAVLSGAGASPKKTYAAINGKKPLNSRLLLGAILAKTKPFYGGRLLLSGETLEETRQFGLESRDSDTIYQLLLSVEGTEAAALIRQENPEECTIGFRSLDRIDVDAIAREFGGGGHKNASGAKVPGTITELEEQVVKAFSPWFRP
ncbi:MAG: bifunctional oligoribonuclease/PAP phosphatase NrnA [Spirochaetaceae bacterium]|jgi:phosphoesterase RecJ-like protein|nr:bifunctional oligoribonuclease/PAP phosphatase NrnA [Spirochaetaceae bacterium]